MNSTDVAIREKQVRFFLDMLKNELDLIFDSNCYVCTAKEKNIPISGTHSCCQLSISMEDVRNFNYVLLQVEIPWISLGHNRFNLKLDQEELYHRRRTNTTGEYILILINQLLNRVGDFYNPIRQVYIRLQSYVKDAAEHTNLYPSLHYSLQDAATYKDIKKDKDNEQ